MKADDYFSLNEPGSPNMSDLGGKGKGEESGYLLKDNRSDGVGETGLELELM